MIVLVILGGGHTSDKKWDLLVTPPDLPIPLQASPGTIGMLETLHRPAASMESTQFNISQGVVRILELCLSGVHTVQYF